MSREIDIFANLIFRDRDKKLAVKAEGNKITLTFRKMSLGQILRELRALQRLHMLERMWRISRSAGWLVYLKYGPFRFRVSRPFFWRVLMRFVSRTR